MTEEPVQPQRIGGRERVRAQFRNLRNRTSQSIVGPAELIALAGSLLIVFIVIVAYIYFLVPARSRLSAARIEYARLQTQLQNSQKVFSEGQTTETTVQNIVESIDSFENDQLVSPVSGRMRIYDSLNETIRKNGLRNTSGPTYAPLEPVGSKNASGGRSANTKWQTIYPGMAISVTVEGQYQNLRRFVRDIEASRQFVIINSIELERSTETNAGATAVDVAAGGARGSSLVSLRVDMATYFQKDTGSAATSTGQN